MTEKELNYKYNCVCEENYKLREKLEKVTRCRYAAEKVAEATHVTNCMLAEDIRTMDKLLDELFEELSVHGGRAIILRKKILAVKKNLKTASIIKKEEKRNG